MYDYLRDELPALIRSEFSVGERCAVSGHSMGGHGALIMALKIRPLRQRLRLRADRQSLPVPWGKKAFTAYLGADESAWHSGTAVR